MRSRTLMIALLIGLAATSAFPAENPWPRIRKERIQKLLPAAMERAGVDAWIVVCRENGRRASAAAASRSPP